MQSKAIPALWNRKWNQCLWNRKWHQCKSLFLRPSLLTGPAREHGRVGAGWFAGFKEVQLQMSLMLMANPNMLWFFWAEQSFGHPCPGPKPTPEPRLPSSARHMRFCKSCTNKMQFLSLAFHYLRLDTCQMFWIKCYIPLPPTMHCCTLLKNKQP